MGPALLHRWLCECECQVPLSSHSLPLSFSLPCSFTPPRLGNNVDLCFVGQCFLRLLLLLLRLLRFLPLALSFSLSLSLSVCVFLYGSNKYCTFPSLLPSSYPTSSCLVSYQSSRWQCIFLNFCTKSKQPAPGGPLFNAMMSLSRSLSFSFSHTAYYF